MKEKIRQFKLSEQFLEPYRDREVPWGYGQVGYVTFKRTYARRLDETEPGAVGTEEWWQTCRRVIEGMFYIQKKHILGLGLEWNDAKAQRTAKDAYERLFVMKWTPPGRGLWMMGTKFVEERTAAGLFNCGFISTKELPGKGAEIFAWIMDALMLGVGVGFDTLGAGTFKIKQPGTTRRNYWLTHESENLYLTDFNDDCVCIIADTREGWVESVQVVLDSFFSGATLPSFDYSEIRSAGQPIRGFGGTSSGPGPLIELHETLIEFYKERIDLLIRGIDIVDTENFIGRCVVSGNVRRSAALSLGDKDDFEYLNMKNPDELDSWIKQLSELSEGTPEFKSLELEIQNHPLRHHRWGSNNSFSAEIGMDYSWHAERTRKNGEPGYVWLYNARNYGRMKDPPRDDDLLVDGFNPCFAGNTLVAVADGRGAVSIKQLAIEGRDVPVYSVNPEDGMVSIKYGRNPRLTGTGRTLLRVVLDDDTSVEVTPDHKFYLLDGTPVLAKNLRPGDSLPRLTKRLEQISGKDTSSKYLQLKTNTRNTRKDRVFEHRLVAKFFHKEAFDSLYDESKQSGWIKGGVVIHHIDFNKLNNSPDNLQCMTWSDHSALHARDMHGKNNSMYGKTHSDETKDLIGASSKARWSTEEFKEKQKEAWSDNRKALASATMSSMRQEKLHAYYLEEKANTDLETIWDQGHLKAIKPCETCSIKFIMSWAKRGATYCSISCANKKQSSIEARKAGQKTAFESKQRATLHSQIQIFKDLESSLNRSPFKKEWELECSAHSISKRFRSGTNSSNNPHALKSFKDLKQRATDYNHRVLRIEEVQGTHDVYNISVEDNHTLGIATSYDPKTGTMSGIYAANCVEMQLENRELCNVPETFPAKHDNLDDYLRTIKIAYLYGKTVTLVRTHWAETNGKMQKNRRIGTGISGVRQAINKIGYREFMKWCDSGYEFIQKLDHTYSDWLCVPRSKRTTTIKPSGSVSLLNGSTPGIHFPEDEYYIRRIRFSDQNNMIPVLKESGYYIEECVSSPNTVIVSFPVKEPLFRRGKRDASMWEQLQLAADMQHYWADNSVSVTITFKPEESSQIKTALEMYETKLKAVSFLQYEESGYVQAPYEPITREKYEEMTANIVLIEKFSTELAGSGVKFCDGDTCNIQF